MVFFSPAGEPLLNPYLVLKIEFGASDDDIAKAYKKLMLQLHPDKQPADQSEEEAEEVSNRFHEVMGAKSFLLDGEHLASRRQFDSRLAAARTKAQAHPQTKQQQRSLSAPHSASEKDHSDPKVESSAHKSKATTKSTSNKTEPNKAEGNKTEETYKKPNINKKQWGRPARRLHNEKNSSEPTKLERKSSCSTTSEDSSSDAEGHHHGRSANRRKSSLNDEHKLSSNTSRSKHGRQKKSPSSDKPCKDSRKDSSSKRTPEKAKKGKSHAISSKEKRASDTDKSSGIKTSSNKGETFNKGTGRGLTDNKSSSLKKASKTECTKQKQHSKTESNNHKFSASCSSFFHDDDKKGRITSYVSKSSVGGKASDNNANRKGSFEDKATPSRAPLSSQTPPTPPKAAPDSPAAPNNAPTPSLFHTFQPAVETLTKQYLCPLTKEVMNEPMTDFEGNHYERDAILKYLETHSTSPVTGNPLYPMHLTPNSALKERIKYTLKLKNCLDTLTHQEKSTLASGTMNESNVQTSQQCHFRPLSLRQSVDLFIEELNSASPNGIINCLDSSGKASFTYKGLDYIMQVPEGLSHLILLQTRFDQDRKAAGISARIVEWNRSFQEIGLGGKLTFRNVKGKFAFTLTMEMKPEKFCKRDLKHAMEYYLEMSIKLHNTINVTDQKKVDKVRLQDSSFAQ